MFSCQQKKLILHYYRMQQEKRQLKTKPKNYGPINKHICNIHSDLLCLCNTCSSPVQSTGKVDIFYAAVNLTKATNMETVTEKN